MPRPIYIICAESGAEDKLSGLVSHYNVVECMAIRKIPKAPESSSIVIAPSPLWITALWERTSGDEGQQFEFETVLILPPDQQEVKAASGVFAFEKLRHRFTVRMMGLIPFRGPGTCWVESRVRQVGATEWLKQSFSLILQADDQVQDTEAT